MNNNNPLNMIMGLLANGNNPQALANQLMQSNPQLKVIFNQMQQSGMSAQQFAQQFAKQNGIDISPMVNMMNKRGIKL